MPNFRFAFPAPLCHNTARMWELIRGFFLRLLGAHHYDYQRVLERYGYALVQPISDLHRFSLLLPYIVIKAMKLASASVIVFDPKAGNYQSHVIGGESGETALQPLSQDSILIQELAGRKKELILSEVEKEKGREALTAEMRRLEAELIVPAFAADEASRQPRLILAVNLGRLLSGDDFTPEDIHFMTKFTNQIAENLMRVSA